MIIDTHVHYNLEPLVVDWRKYWNDAQIAGVGKSIVVGTDPETNKKAMEIASQDPNLFAAVGIHPHEGKNSIDEQIQELNDLIKKNKDHIVAIGECGLDYFRTPEDQLESVRQHQKTLFEKQVLLAKQYNLPVIIHCRDAYDDMLSILKSHSGIRFVLHCMSGTVEYLQAAVELGGYISFAANVTYKTADLIRELAKATPQDRLLVETDAPFLPPQQLRGKMNDPANIVETVAMLAETRGISKDECEAITTANAESIFGL